MVAPKKHFSVKNLEKLVKEKHSCIHLKKFKKHLSLDPSELADTKASIRTNLNKLIPKYDSEMDGVVLGFRRMKVTSSLGKILNDNPHIHFDVEADFFIFRPEIGCMLTGIVKKMNNDCIGCLVHDIFNVTIPFEYNNNIDQEDIYCGQQLTFVVDFVDFSSSLPYIKGKLGETLDNFESSQSPDAENPGSYVMSEKMKKRKSKLYSQSSVSNKLVGESDDKDANDWENEESESFSGYNITPKHPISILKKEKAENTPSKRISFYGDIPSSLETLEKEQSLGSELSKMKKSKKKAKSNLETKPENQGMADSKKIKREKKERIVPEIDVSDFPQSQMTSDNDLMIVSEDPLNETPTKKKKKKKSEKSNGLNTSAFQDYSFSDGDIKEDDEEMSENIDSLSDIPLSQCTSDVSEMEIISEDLLNESPTKKKKKKEKKHGLNTSAFQDYTHSDKDVKEDDEDLSENIDSLPDFPLSQCTSDINEMTIISEDLLNESSTKKKKKKEKKRSLNTSGFQDNTQSHVYVKDEEHESKNVDSNSIGSREKKGKKIKNKDKNILETIEFRGPVNDDGVKSKKHKSSTEILDFSSSTLAELKNQTNLEKITRKENDLPSSVGVMEENKDIKLKKRKRPSESLDVSTSSKFCKLSDQATPVTVKSKKLTTLSGPSQTDLSEQNPDAMKLKKRKRSSELLGSTLTIGVDLENNSREMIHEHTDVQSEMKGSDTLIINSGNEKDKSSNSPKRRKKKKAEGECESQEEITNLMQITNKKVVSNEILSEGTGEKKSVSPRKGIGFSSFRTEKTSPSANSTVIAPSLSENKNTSSFSIGDNLFDLPSPIKKAEHESEMFNDMGFITSTQVDPEDNVFDKALSNIDRIQKISTITGPEKSSKTKLKLSEKVKKVRNVSKLTDKGQPFKTSIQVESPSKTNSPIEIKGNRMSKKSDTGARGQKKVTAGQLGKQLLSSLEKSLEAKPGKTKPESELSSSDPDLPSHFKNSTTLSANLGTKFKSAIDTKESDTDEDTAAVSFMRTDALEPGAISPEKKGKKVLEHIGHALKSELGECNPGRPTNTKQQLKQKKSSNPIIPQVASKKSVNSDSEESQGGNTVPSLKKLPKTGKSNKMKKQSKKVQSEQDKSSNFSPENLSSLADALLQNI